MPLLAPEKIEAFSISIIIDQAPGEIRSRTCRCQPDSCTEMRCVEIFGCPPDLWQGIHFFTMEYCGGMSLRQLIELRKKQSSHYLVIKPIEVELKQPQKEPASSISC